MSTISEFFFSGEAANIAGILVVIIIMRVCHFMGWGKE